jgi:hypothetical protein
MRGGVEGVLGFWLEEKMCCQVSLKCDGKEEEEGCKTRYEEVPKKMAQ